MAEAQQTAKPPASAAPSFEVRLAKLELAVASLGAATQTYDNDGLKLFWDWFKEFKDKVKRPPTPEVKPDEHSGGTAKGGSGAA